MRNITIQKRNIFGTKLSIFAGALMLFTNAHAIPVDLELALGVDVSPSIDSTEFNLQRQGYIDAFNNPTIQNAINSGAIGAIAVNYYYWDFNIEFQTGYTLIDDGTNGIIASDFSAMIGGTSQGSTSGTGIANAIGFGSSSFGSNGFEGNRLVIDISGDGEENGTSLAGLQSIRDSAEANGITINGLAILGLDFPNLDEYYELNVQTSDGFTIAAADFSDFGNVVVTKLETEIGNPIPEPPVYALLFVGLTLLYSTQRQRRNTSS